MYKIARIIEKITPHNQHRVLNTVSRKKHYNSEKKIETQYLSHDVQYKMLKTLRTGHNIWLQRWLIWLKYECKSTN